MSDELSIEDLKIKIARVETDLNDLQKDSTAGRKFEVLAEYLDYLKDELRFKQNENTSNTR